jgi:DHA3 family multidrug efflux protein-like MFS transporter
MISSVVTISILLVGTLVFVLTPIQNYTSVSGFHFWFLSFLVLLGVLSGNLYDITIPTLVTLLVPEERRDKANGMVGIISGIAFALTSMASGVVVGFGGLFWAMTLSIIFAAIGLVLLMLVRIPETVVISTHQEMDTTPIDLKTKSIDLKGTNHHEQILHRFLHRLYRLCNQQVIRKMTSLDYSMLRLRERRN